MFKCVVVITEHFKYYVLPLCEWLWILANVRIGLGNGLVLSGNKPLPEPMSTEIYVAIWGHLATMSW